MVDVAVGEQQKSTTFSNLATNVVYRSFFKWYKE